MYDERSVFERLDSIETTNLENNKMLSEILGILKEEEPKPVENKPQRVLSRQPTQKELFREFLTKAKKSWGWFGGVSEFKNKKRLTQIAFVLLIIFGAISTLITSLSAKIYTTFTFLENVYLILGIIAFAHVNKSQHLYEIHSLARNSSFKYQADDVGMLFPRKEKVVFIVFRWIAGISVIANIIYIWMQKSDISLLATVFEVLFLAALILSSIAYFFLLTNYCIIFVDGKKIGSEERVILVSLPGQNGLITEEEFKAKMPFFYD